MAMKDLHDVRHLPAHLMSMIMVVLVAAAVAVVTPVATAVGQDGMDAPDGPDTEDILFMADGRELHGKIISETRDRIVFKFVDRVLGLKTTLRLNTDDVERIRRDVAIQVTTRSEPRQTRRTRRSSATSRSDEQPEAARYGRSRYDSDAADVPTVYVVPLKGQMGTDIHTTIYEKVVEDIKLHEPDLVVFVLESSEYPDLMIPEVEDPRESRGLLAIDEYRDLVSMLKSELADYRQVLWIKDSVGFSSMLALAWSELYMSPDTRFWGLRSVIDRSGADKWSDDDVRAKMSAAWSAFVKSFLEYGDQGMELADAMLWPEKLLSASYHGREVVWSLNDLGEFVIDNDDEKTLALRAKAAEDLLISDGTVESLDDLAFLLGYREYRELDGAVAIVEDYVKKWRAMYDKTEELWADYHQHRGWASGRDTRKYLGRAKRDLEQIIKAMTRYKAVEIRWQTDQGVTKLALEIEVEKMREELRALRGTRGNTGGGGGGFGSGGPG